MFSNFSHWQDGYGAFTLSRGEIDPLIDYIKGHVEHHYRTTFAEECRKLLVEAGIEFDERYNLLSGRMVGPFRAGIIDAFRFRRFHLRLLTDSRFAGLVIRGEGLNP